MSLKVLDVVDSETFDREVLDSTVPVLVDFSAPRCKPCMTVAPTLEDVAREFEGRARVVSVDTDRSPWLVSRFSIRGIPTVMLFNRGKVVRATVGVRPREEYVRLLARELTRSRLPRGAPRRPVAQ